MSVVRFILKNGSEFTVCCETASVTITDNALIGRELTGYKLKGIKRGKPLYVDLSQVAAVIDDSPADDANNPD